MHRGITSVRPLRVRSFLFITASLIFSLFLLPGQVRSARANSSESVSTVWSGQTATISFSEGADVFWVGAAKKAAAVRTGDGSSHVQWSVKDLEDIAVDNARSVVWTGIRKEIIKYAMDGSEVLRYALPVPKRTSESNKRSVGKDMSEQEEDRGDCEEDHEDDTIGTMGRLRLSLDPSDGSLWVGARTELIKLSSDGRLLLRRTLPAGIIDVSVDIADGSCWVGLHQKTVNYSAAGQAGRTVTLKKGNHLSAVAADPLTRSIWIGTRKGFIKIDRYGVEQVRTNGPSSIQDLAFDTSSGALWLITNKEVFKYDPSGQQLLHLKPCPRDRVQEHHEGSCDSKADDDDDQEHEDDHVHAPCDDDLIALAADPSNGSSFIAWRRSVLLLNSDGAALKWFDGFKQIEAIDVGLPKLAVTITAPANASVVTSETVTVTGKVSDPSSKVTVNGREATLAGRTFEAKEVPLFVGENRLTASAVNLAHLTSSASITVLRQSSQPSLTIKITSPHQDESLITSRITVTGTVSDPAATVIVNGVQAEVSGNIYMAPGVPIVIGSNTITASALDTAGRSASDIVTVQHGWLSVEILYPTEGEEMAGQPIYVEGVVNDPAAKVMVNGIEAWVDPDGYYSANYVKLKDGWNEIVAQATNRDGQVATATRQIYLKQQVKLSPALQIIAPADGSLISSPTFTVFGMVNDPTADVIVNDVPAQITGNLFSAVVHACVEGETVGESDQCEIVITVYTSDGNTSWESLRYVYEPAQEPLEVEFKEPFRRSTVTYSPIEVWGEVRDGLTGFSRTKVDVNGIAATVINGEFHATIPLSELGNTLTVHARNLFGHDAYDVMELRYEPQTNPLAVTLTSPVDGAIVNQAELAVSGIVSDSTAEVDINGEPALMELRSFTGQNIVLAPGKSTLIATAVRRNGETATAVLSVTYDPSYPSPPAPVLAGLPLLVRTANIEVAGVALPLHEVEIVVNGEVQGRGRSESSGLFKIIAGLTREGPNHVSARVRDAFGNVSGLSSEALVGRDTLPPALSNVFLNIDSMNLRVSRVFVTGQTEPFADITVKIDDDPDLVYHGRANERGEFFPPILMSAGKHLITIIARDGAGNSSSNTRLRNVFPLDRNRPMSPRLDPQPSPVSGALITVEGSAYARFSVELYRNNELMGVMPVDTRGRFRFEGVNLVQGANILRARQKEDQFDLGTSYLLLKAEDSPEVTVEAVSGAAVRPTVSIDFPRDGSITNAGHIPLRGSIEPQEVWMLLSGSYGSNETGAWSANGRFTSFGAIPLLPGPNTLWAEAIAPDGSRGVHKITVHYRPDAEAPEIAITSPADHSLVYSSPVAVAGTAGSSNKIIVNEAEPASNGENFSAAIDLWGGGYTHRPDLPWNMITAWAMDEAGRIGHHEVTVGYKYVPVPVIEVASPAEGQVVGSASLIISGTAFNAGEVTVNGATAVMAGNSFSADVDLREGMNSFNIIAKNGPKAAGMTLTVYYYPESQVSLQSVAMAPASLSLPLGRSAQITAIGTYSNGQWADLARTCGWTSNDETVAIVNGGYVISKKWGRTTVTAQCDSFLSEVPVSVGEPTIEELQVAYEKTGADGVIRYAFDSPRLNPGDKISFRAVGTYANGNIEDLTALATWMSGKPAVAVPDSRGSATALSLGTAGITATYNGVSGSTTLTVVPPVITLVITSPTEWWLTDKDRITVKGAVFSKATEVGVRVNGMPATVSGNQFVVNHVPLTEWNNVIKVAAMDTNGATAEATVVVFSDPFGNPLRLAASIESGIAPLETVIRIDGVPTGVTPDIKASGPGAVEFMDCTDPTSCKVRLTAEGIYTFTVTSPGYDGNTYSDKIAITVLDKAKLDALLKSKWEGMKAKLAIGDVEGAVSYLADSSKDAYKIYFNALSHILPQVVADMGLFRLVKIREHLAEYDLRTQQNGTVYSFQVLFIRDGQGRWGIRSF